MGVPAWLAVLTLVGTLVLLARSRVPPWLILMGALVVVTTAGIVEPPQAMAGFASDGLLTVAALFIVAAGLRETGALAGVAERLLGRPASLAGAQARLMLPVMAMSAFVNNTPVVAAFVPLVSDWGKTARLSPSKLMLPLSYAAILGGTCTLIGTSTNLVVNSLLAADPGQRGLSFFELAWVGVPVALAGCALVIAASPWLLPARVPPVGDLSDPREYTVEMLVTSGSPLAGRTIEEAGLRQLPGLFLIEIQRGGRVLPAVGPAEVLNEHDRLVFAGATESVADLQRMRGLAPATDQVFKLDTPRADRRLAEVVVALDSPLVGRSVRGSRFRSRYNAVVIAVGRGGERVRGRIGDIVLRGGDLLLVESEPGFVRAHGASRDFLLVRRLGSAPVPRYERTALAWAVVGAMAGAVTAGWLSILNASMLAAGAMIALGCLDARAALRSVDLEVLIVIAAAFGLGRALETSGAAAALAGGWLSLAGGRPLVLLALVYISTSLLTEVLTNNAAAALMYPLASAAARAAGLDVLPFAVAIMMGASASFATPIGYQTNLMVFGPGGYRFGDYVRAGVPLKIAAGLVAVPVIARVWAL